LPFATIRYAKMGYWMGRRLSVFLYIY
jgi:hypothetical protein